jgi:pSer/pThr/pTyr-binding forkhead associated (FHA) protein
MSKLILSFEGTVLQTVAVGRDRITIGRKPENDIQVDNLAVSGLHAAVTMEGDDVVLEDLHSTNGTIVNGQLIQKHVLHNFDVIELGKHKLKYVVESAAAHAQAEKTMVMRRPLMPQAPAPAAAHAPAAPPAPPAPRAAPPAPPPYTPAAAPAPAPAAAAEHQRDAALQILSGPAAGRLLELTKAATKVGRPGVEMSVIARRPNGYFITHLEGTGSPQLNGKAIGDHTEQLHDQDTLEIAGTKMSFFYKT